MSNLLKLETRKKIYDTICSYPGIHMRELQRKTGLATGSIDYHLHSLYKNGFIRIQKGKRFTRYYNSMQSFSESEKQLLSMLRQDNMRRIIVFLLDKKEATASDIGTYSSLQPSNLSGYLKALESNGIIQHKTKGRYRLYSVINRESIIDLLVEHKKSFVDRIVDNFISVWLDE